jgi:hypothetical protein
MRYSFLMFFILSCSSAPIQLTDKAKELEVYATKPRDCTITGRFIGVDKMGSKELALNHALNQSSEVESTGVFINEEVPNGKIMNVHVTAYKCD